jgi:glutaredoxin
LFDKVEITMPLHVRLYTRPGCHLCEDALNVVENLRDDFNFLLEEVNIDEDPALKERLGHQIPVITVDGGNKITGDVTEERVRRAFNRARKARDEAPKQQ